MERYEITVDSAVGPLVLEALDGFEVVDVVQGRSRLVGQVVDQAALHGMLNRLQDLHLEIIELHRVSPA
jgi:hypothetical protein